MKPDVCIAVLVAVIRGLAFVASRRARALPEVAGA
jgi:hypothetical protein